MKCICCNSEGKFSILLTEGTYGDQNIRMKRLYLPNQNVRESSDEHPDLIKEVWFCHKCMRKVEDNLRATILYLKAENSLISIHEE